MASLYRLRPADERKTTLLLRMGFIVWAVVTVATGKNYTAEFPISLSALINMPEGFLGGYLGLVGWLASSLPQICVSQEKLAGGI